MYYLKIPVEIEPMFSMSYQQMQGYAPVPVPQATPQATPHLVPQATPQITPTATPHLVPQATPTATPHLVPQATPQATPTMYVPAFQPTYASWGGYSPVPHQDMTGGEYSPSHLASLYEPAPPDMQAEHMLELMRNHLAQLGASGQPAQVLSNAKAKYELELEKVRVKDSIDKLEKLAKEAVGKKEAK